MTTEHKGYFNKTAYTVIDGNIVYAKDLNNPMSALETGLTALVNAIQTGEDILSTTDTGALNAYVLELPVVLTEYSDGQMVWLKPAATNTGPATINVNSLGAVNIRTTNQTALIGGELIEGQWFQLKYSTTTSAFAIVSDPGQTSYVGGDTLIAGDGIGISTVDDEITIEVADGEITPEKLADDAVTMAKLDNAGKVTRRDIIGGDIYPVWQDPLSYLVVTACECWDSSGEQYLQVSQGTLSAQGDPGDIWNIYACRLTNGSYGFRKYLEGAAQADEDASVSHYRRLDFWHIGADDRFVPGRSTGGFHMFSKASDCILSAGIGTSYAMVDHSVLLPESMIAAIEYGVKDAATAASIIASDDGTNVSFTVGLTTTSSGDTAAGAWGDTTSQISSLKPFNANRQFKSSSGTLDLLVHQVVLRR